jgi:hypothetical protein
MHYVQKRELTRWIKPPMVRRGRRMALTYAPHVRSNYSFRQETGQILADFDVAQLKNLMLENALLP